MGMNNMEHIDPRERLSKEDFTILFTQVPLNEEESYKVLNVYWPLYEKMVEHPEVEPVTAWMATKNTFIAAEPQIGKRINNK